MWCPFGPLKEKSSGRRGVKSRPRWSEFECESGAAEQTENVLFGACWGFIRRQYLEGDVALRLSVSG